MAGLEVPEFTHHEFYRLLGRWVATDLERVRRMKKYAGMYRMWGTTKPWGWPLAPERGQYRGSSLGEVKDVYFARDCTGMVKVGFSYKPSVRVTELGGGCRLLLIVCDCIRGHEQALHNLLEMDRFDGEWFQGDMTESLVKFLLVAASEKASKVA